MKSGSHTKRLSDFFPARKTRVNYLVNWSPQLKIIYVETPKVGCTTIKQILQYAEYGFDISKVPTDDRLHEREYSPLKSPLDDEQALLRCLDCSEYFIFSFVRNPYTRVLSAYLDKIVGRSGSTTPIQKRMGIDPSVYIPTFEEFLTIVYDQSMDEMNPHWAPQTFLLGMECVKYDYLGRFEFFQDSLEQLVAKTQLRLPGESVDFGRQHATSANTQLADYYTPRALGQVQEIYQDDFKRLGYGWRL